ncbi:MAG: lysine--tRNA ligase, partial [Acidobacteriota bacterium]
VPRGGRMAYWADEIADRIDLRVSQRLSTGISPSGEIHLGNLREIMTAEGVFRVLQERKARVSLDFIADNLDPLRRVYPFLDRETYEPLMGRSLAFIPCPCGRHDSYSEHFLEPFLAALQELGVMVNVVQADLLYASGRMNDVIGQALASRQRVATILQDLTGKEIRPEWSPFDTRCGTCQRLTTTTVTGFDAHACTVSYKCSCGAEGEVPFAGGGKLTWRVDWPARWKVLGVTLEPFGKDHASRGGSYDTGVRIAREIFGVEPPFPVPYEWISLKGKGDMSSSRGNVLSVGEMLEVVPPELLRYLVLRAEPRRAIRFDPGLPILNLFDELEDPSNRGRNERAAALATGSANPSCPVPFRHLVTVAQVAEFDTERTLGILKRTGYKVENTGALAKRLGYVRRWLEAFAPDELRFSVSEDLPPAAGRLSAEQRSFLRTLADRLPQGATGEEIHTLIYDLVGKDRKPAPFFQALYLAFTGKERGPRAGHFLAALPPALLRRRLLQAGRE